MKERFKEEKLIRFNNNRYNEDAKQKELLEVWCGLSHLCDLAFSYTYKHRIQACMETHMDVSKCSFKTTKKCCKAELIQRLMLYSLPLKSVLKKEPGHP